MKAIYTITKEEEVNSLINIIKALEHGIDTFSTGSVKNNIYSAINDLNQSDRVFFKQLSDLIKHDDLTVKILKI